jgi:hypothetical protein
VRLLIRAVLMERGRRILDNTCLGETELTTIFRLPRYQFVIAVIGCLALTTCMRDDQPKNERQPMAFITRPTTQSARPTAFDTAREGEVDAVMDSGRPSPLKHVR